MSEVTRKSGQAKAHSSAHSVVLLSGGMDSCVCAALALADGASSLPLSAALAALTFPPS